MLFLIVRFDYRNENAQRFKQIKNAFRNDEAEGTAIAKSS